MKGLKEVDEKEFYQLMLKIQSDIGELKNKIDIFNATNINTSKCSENMDKQAEKHQNKIDELDKKIKESDKKINSLQNFQYTVHGALMVINVLMIFAIKKWG
jgi:uncharacterized coiled-coil DUF342 family protein